MSHWKQSTWSPPVATGPISRDILRAHRQALANKLQVALLSQRILPSIAADRVFNLHFGHTRTPAEKVLFKHFAGPLLRQISLRLSCDHALTSESERECRRLIERLAQLRTLDPKGLRIIEMRYFSGCTLHEIAGLYGCAIGDSFVADTAVLPIDGAEPVPPRAAMRQVKLTLRFWANLLPQCQKANIGNIRWNYHEKSLRRTFACIRRYTLRDNE